MTFFSPALRRLMEELPPRPAEAKVPRISRCRDSRGRSYYHAGITTAYYGPYGPCVPGGPGAEKQPDLSELEWALNDLHLDSGSPALPPVLSRALAIADGWQAQMEREFPETAFDIFLSADDGADLIEECGPRFPSVNLRFYARREGTYHIRPERLSDEDAQPMLLVFVNRADGGEKEA